MRSLAVDVIKHAFSQRDEGKLHKRLYSAICRSILDGSLRPAVRMPPSRDLAEELGLSRNTVLRVYEQLQAEGYISTRTNSGTFVTDSVLDNLDASPEKQATRVNEEDYGSLSARGLELLGNASASPKQWGPFLPGVPDVVSFPHRILKKFYDRQTRQARPEHLTYDTVGGAARLKSALADYLRSARGVRCSPDQILITEGIHQALDLVTRSLCNPGDNAWIEEPGYWGIKNILRMNAVNFSALPVDEQGMVAGEPHRPAPRLIFVTPSHQYPLGSVMSLSRRKTLLALARETRSWIVEDDYDSEFRFAGQPIPSLQGLEEHGPVIYIGTFSKTLYPALRLGYVVLPAPLAASLKKIHNELYRGGHLQMQGALADFISEGYYAAHIRKMRQLYARRRQALVTLILTRLGSDYLGQYNSNAGLHLILQLPDGTDDVALAQHANNEGLLVRPLSRYYIGEDKTPGLLLGFAHIDERELEPCFNRLAALVKAVTVDKTVPEQQ
ncbi:PLP-dependent aminotransferase family protein [Mixta intestinalis]|uniref:HTH-type transcriptional regulatory protein GabR n=1 Tax=Mixta intestinalis TaxID=1615494 RepID=A0A6P1PYR6_9GAMM|nr:PLP-dependent aminotransferase family protein [Mixta intestinalis]QHM70999.1 HTH-type transcriptional regulatory protein GabR [Mixta intestinalis]